MRRSRRGSRSLCVRRCNFRQSACGFWRAFATRADASPRSGREVVCTTAVAARATPGCTRSRSIVAGVLVCVDFRREMACRSGRSSRVRRDVPLGANERGAVAIHPVLEAMDLTGRRDGERADRLARTFIGTEGWTPRSQRDGELAANGACRPPLDKGVTRRCTRCSEDKRRAAPSSP